MVKLKQMFWQEVPAFMIKATFWCVQRSNCSDGGVSADGGVGGADRGLGGVWVLMGVWVTLTEGWLVRRC
jgi:hypothetical protein